MQCGNHLLSKVVLRFSFQKHADYTIDVGRLEKKAELSVNGSFV